MVVGFTYETETMQPETPVGLRLQDLHQGILTAGSRPSRQLTNQRILLEASKLSVACLVVTTDPSYRSLARCTPEFRHYLLGRNLRINPLDPERMDLDSYTALLSEVLRPFALSDRQWLLLHRLLSNVYTTHNPPTLLDLLEEVRSLLSNGEFSDYGERRDANLLERLVTTLTSGVPGLCFTGLSHPAFTNLLAPGITLLECPQLEREVQAFLAALLLAKVCAARADETWLGLHPSLLLLLEDADLLFGSSPRGWTGRSAGHGAVLDLRHWQSRFAALDVSIHLSTDHPGFLPPGTAGLFGTIIAHRLNLREDLEAVQVPLKLSQERTSPYSRKRESLHHLELLRRLEPGHALLTRPDLPTAIPIRTFPPSPLSSDIPPPPLPSPSIQPAPVPTMLHKDFAERAGDAARLLTLLREYNLTPTALAEITSLPPHLVTHLLETLVAHRYALPLQEGRRRPRRTVFTITPKGENALNEYARYLDTHPSPDH